MKLSKPLVFGMYVLVLGLAASSSAVCTLNDGIETDKSSYVVGEDAIFTIQLGASADCDSSITGVNLWYFGPDNPPPETPGGAPLPCLDPEEGELVASGLTLTPGGTPLIYQRTHTVTAADALAGIIRGYYAVEFTKPGADPSCDQDNASASVTPPEPCIEITKEVDCDVATVGAEVTYTYCIYNCGPLELEVTDLVDDVVGDLLADFYAANGDSYLLGPDDDEEGGDDEVCFTVQYTIPNADDDPLFNEVRVDAVDTQFAQTVYDDAVEEVDIVDVDFTVTKECVTDPVPEGEDAEFGITITNTGDVDLIVVLDEDVIDDTDATIPAGTDIELPYGTTLNFTAVLPSQGEDVFNEIEACAELPPDTTICFDPDDFPICKSASDTCTVQGDTFCSFTQGFYGNEGGKACGGQTTTELIAALIASGGPVVVGLPGRQITFDTPACIIQRLPAGGPAAVLPAGTWDCDDLPNSLVKKNKPEINNVLVGQVVALSLNVRLGLLEPTCLSNAITDSPLGDFLIPADPFCTVPAEEEGCPEQYESLGGFTVSALLAKANEALGGEDISPYSINQINDAVTAINEAFDECRTRVTCPTEEICDNGCDDDFDGYIDGDDPDCD